MGKVSIKNSASTSFITQQNVSSILWHVIKQRCSSVNVMFVEAKLCTNRCIALCRRRYFHLICLYSRTQRNCVWYWYALWLYTQKKTFISARFGTILRWKKHTRKITRKTKKVRVSKKGFVNTFTFHSLSFKTTSMFVYVSVSGASRFTTSSSSWCMYSHKV